MPTPLRLIALALFALIPLPALAEPSPAATAAFNAYAASIEARLARQHQSAASFLTLQHLPITQPVIENLTPSSRDFPGAMLHHWRGTAFAPGATAAQFEAILRNLSNYTKVFAPEVTKAGQLGGPEKPSDANHIQAYLRLRQHHVLTVVLDSNYEIAFSALDPQHRSSLSRSTHIAEIASPDTSSEHALSPADEHGFLWRLNTYWSWEERPEGLYLQIETISLTRSIPPGLGWAVGPFVQSIPRESLEFTLRSACNALRK
ncbi:MAG TPA: hypothetical protein VIM62_00335 [Acidobacteriaceae bacterium]